MLPQFLGLAEEEYVRPENLSTTASRPAPRVRAKSGALSQEKQRQPSSRNAILNIRKSGIWACT